MTNPHLLRVAGVRRSLIVPIVAFTVINGVANLPAYDARSLVNTFVYVLFDTTMWIGVTFLVFAVIERRQNMPPQPRIAAMALATVGIAGLAMTAIALRALFGSILDADRPFLSVFLAYLPGPFFAATFYVAIATGIGYAVYSWAVDDRRLAEAAELDAAIARAELKAATGRLQPELLDVALARLSTMMPTNAPAAQRLIADLGALLHDSLAHSQSELVSLGEELDYVEHYVDFHRAVEARPMHVSIVADAEACSRQIPHFAVLALVQDAIAHSTQARIELLVDATVVGNVVRIAVSERPLHARLGDGAWKVELELPAA